MLLLLSPNDFYSFDKMFVANAKRIWEKMKEDESTSEIAHHMYPDGKHTMIMQHSEYGPWNKLVYIINFPVPATYSIAIIQHFQVRKDQAELISVHENPLDISCTVGLLLGVGNENQEWRRVEFFSLLTLSSPRL